MSSSIESCILPFFLNHLTLKTDQMETMWEYICDATIRVLFGVCSFCAYAILVLVSTSESFFNIICLGIYLFVTVILTTFQWQSSEILSSDIITVIEVNSFSWSISILIWRNTIQIFDMTSPCKSWCKRFKRKNTNLFKTKPKAQVRE